VANRETHEQTTLLRDVCSSSPHLAAAMRPSNVGRLFALSGIRSIRASYDDEMEMKPLEHSNSRFESIRFVMRIDSNRFVL